MILSKDNINTNKIQIIKKLKYPNDFFLYLLKYDKKQLLFQTPKLFVPYGIQCFNNKKYISISLLNKNNDENINNFINNLNKIEILVKKKFKSKKVISILKEDNIKLKIYNSLYFDEQKNLIESIPSNIYGNFIIHLHCIWEYKNILYFQCNLSQAKVYIPIFLKEYSFIDENKINKINKIPPPPPLPPSFTIKKYERVHTNIKNKPIKLIDFNPPSINDIRNALKKMKINKIHKVLD
tara:strand:- start:69 stop:782 length:714 start_codon:yes stop_codon:yes gene_type:complete